VTDTDEQLRFERVVLPHLDAAYNLARWLTRNDHDAADVVQEAMLRALRYFGSLRGEQARPWLLQIVRHTCFSWLQENHPHEVISLDESDSAWQEIPGPSAEEPHMLASRNADRARIDRALSSIPVAYREVIVLREMEDLSYKDIARIANIPVGTVMSRLSRARSLLRRMLEPQAHPPLRQRAVQHESEVSDAS